MAQWVRLCGVRDAPAEGQVMEVAAGDVTICLARVGGELAAVENACPHRDGPLGQGWVENGAVVCPWHSWAFDLKTGLAEFPEGEKVGVFGVKVVGDEVMVEV